MKRQTDLQLIGYINKYGCFFMSVVYYFNIAVNKIELEYKNLNSIWMQAIDDKIISGDENKDGDMDDDNELLILDKNALLKLAGLRLKYLGSFEPRKVEEKSGQQYIGEFYREWFENGTKKSFTHFAVIDESFKVIYDPILNSKTVSSGILKTVRVFG